VKHKKAAPDQYAPRLTTDATQKFARPGSVSKTVVNPVIDILNVREEGLEFKAFPSKVTTGGSTSKKETIFYTGNEVKGISLVHKSGFMPVFTDEQARDFANMRR
jgi:hypothetical protein